MEMRPLLQKEGAAPTLGLWAEFKAFVSKGNVLDLAVALVISTSFNAIVTSFVNDIIMPPFGAAVGTSLANAFAVIRKGKSKNATYETIAQAAADGAVTENYGRFMLAVINFFIITIAMFVVVKVVTEVRRLRSAREVAAQQRETKECPFCLSDVKLAAVRCPFCTSQLEADAASRAQVLVEEEEEEGDDFE